MNVSKRNTPEVRLGTSCVANEIQVGQMLIGRHASRVERVAKSIREYKNAILHHRGQTTIYTALLGQVGSGDRFRDPGSVHHIPPV